MRLNVLRLRYLVLLSLLYLSLVYLLYRLLWRTRALDGLFDSPGGQAMLTRHEVPEFNLRRVNPPHLPPNVLAELGDVGAADGSMGRGGNGDAMDGASTLDSSTRMTQPPPGKSRGIVSSSLAPPPPPRLHHNVSSPARPHDNVKGRQSSASSAVPASQDSGGVARSQERHSENSIPNKVSLARDHSDNHSDGVGDDSAVNHCLHAFYYMWYGNVTTDGRYYHWNHRYLPHWQPEITQQHPQGRHEPPDDIGASFYPKLGCYSSRDPNLMTAHMHQAKEAGIGVLSVSWYPSGTADDEGFPPDPLVAPLLDVALSHGIKITLHIEPYPNRSPSSVLHDLQYIHKSYSSHPAFYKFRRHDDAGSVKDLPLIYIYDSYLSPVQEWGHVLRRDGSNSVRGKDYDAVVIGLMVEASHMRFILDGGFDGFYTYFASDGFTFGSRTSNWAKLAAFAKENELLFIPSVGPGYDDVRVRPWNKKNSKSRRNGDYYRAMFGSALSHHRGGIVSVTSFNEWHEGTQIEPAVPMATGAGYTYLDYAPHSAEFYLQLTAELSSQMQCPAEML